MCTLVDAILENVTLAGNLMINGRLVSEINREEENIRKAGILICNNFSSFSQIDFKNNNF